MFDHLWRRFRAGLLAACWAASGVACLAQGAVEGDRNLHVEQEVDKALARPINIDFQALELRAAMREIGHLCGVQFLIDHKALEEAGIDEKTEINLSLHGNTTGAALTAMFRPLELTWLVRDGQPMVTTEAQADTELDLRVYPVGDLVISRDEKGTFADFDSLTDVITATVAPTTWSEVGGAGSIKPFFNSQSIVISQTREAHQDIDRLLSELRRAREAQGIGSSARSTSRAPQRTAPMSTEEQSATAAPAALSPDTAAPAARLVRVYE